MYSVCQVWFLQGDSSSHWDVVELFFGYSKWVSVSHVIFASCFHYPTCTMVRVLCPKKKPGKTWAYPESIVVEWPPQVSVGFSLDHMQIKPPWSWEQDFMRRIDHSQGEPPPGSGTVARLWQPRCQIFWLGRASTAKPQNKGGLSVTRMSQNKSEEINLKKNLTFDQ